MQLISFLTLALAALASAGGLRSQQNVEEKLRNLQEANSPPRDLGFGCQIDFLFNHTHARRPNSAEIDAIVDRTSRFFLDQLKLVTNDFVSVSLSNIDLPLHMNSDTYTLHFWANFLVKQESSWDNEALYNVLDGLNYGEDYQEEYVKSATPMDPLEKNVFYHVLNVNFRRAPGHKKENTFRNFASEGKYFEPNEVRKSPLREDSHIYNQKLWQQTVRNGGY